MAAPKLLIGHRSLSSLIAAPPSLDSRSLAMPAHGRVDLEPPARVSLRLRGIAYMISAVFVFAIMDTFLKALSVRYPPLQVGCLRCVSSLVCMSPLLLVRRGWRELRVSGFRWHLLRGALGIIMLAGFVYGVRRLTLSQAYSLYLTAPLMMTALSVPIFHERVPARRWIAILVGLSGVLVILRPWQAGGFSLWAAGAVLLATVCYALSAIAVRSLSRTNSRIGLVFWYLLLVAIGSGALAARQWLPLEPQDWWYLAGLGIAGTLGQLWLTAAFSYAPPSVVGPFEYTAILWAFAIDRVVWSTSPAWTLVIGALVIVGSGIFIIEDERRMTVDTPP
jgi:drug/metabolite transporter (DMT)-like permease